jgi:hypothetical protein
MIDSRSLGDDASEKIAIDNLNRLRESFTARCRERLAAVSVNREFRESRKRSRRCNPEPFGEPSQRLKATVATPAMGRRLRRRESQKTCLADCRIAAEYSKGE